MPSPRPGPRRRNTRRLSTGKDHPVKGNADWDTTALKRVDARTIEFTRKKGGKVVQTARSVVAADGKTRTVTVTGVNAQGQKVNTVALYIEAVNGRRRAGQGAVRAPASSK